MRAIAAGLSDVGKQRVHNEDRFILLPEFSVFVVADGMGGHQSGEVASRMAASSIAAYFRNGEAVHYYPRGSYGFPQSLGCVELPLNEAKIAWPYLSYGSLVSVNRGALTPGTSPTDPTT